MTAKDYKYYCNIAFLFFIRSQALSDLECRTVNFYADKRNVVKRDYGKSYLFLPRLR